LQTAQIKKERDVCDRHNSFWCRDFEQKNFRWSDGVD
jgi:hypothetical protein